MTPQTTDHPPVRRFRAWVQPVTRSWRRPAPLAPVNSLPALAEAPVDDGEDLLRRLREAGL